MTLPAEVEYLADSGYQGLADLHEKVRIPVKKPRSRVLTEEEKEFNKQLAKERVVIEHIIRHLKVFRIVAGKYRNRRRRFMLRMTLIAGLYNEAFNH